MPAMVATIDVTGSIVSGEKYAKTAMQRGTGITPLEKGGHEIRIERALATRLLRPRNLGINPAAMGGRLSDLCPERGMRA